MGIENKDTGKYTKRPGIYFNEIDKSMLIEEAAATIVPNLIPGFSKKGPVNRPVYITNPVDFRAIFGDIDKNLEANGSFFHRTVLKMLENGPVYALNLLATDPLRDQAQYQSISVTAQYDNGTVTSAPYEYFFNRQDFWERDEDAFLENVVDNPTPDVLRLLHITNVSDRDITVFIFRATVKNFDISMSTWYEGVTKVPKYLHPEEWVSDYFVRVVVVSGNWTDYNALSVDTKWSRYFTINGLIKTTINDFVDEDGIVILGDYDVCLIPDFRDKSGLDLFIQDVLNADTDKTGLFVAFKEEVIEGYDYPTGKIDVIGDTLVDSGKQTINFMSYQTSLTDTNTYELSYLDTANNVFGNYVNMYSATGGYLNAGFASRTASYTNMSTSGLTMDTGYASAQAYILTGTNGTTGRILYDNSSLTATTGAIMFNKTFTAGDTVTEGVVYYVQQEGTGALYISTDPDGIYPVIISSTATFDNTYRAFQITNNLNVASSATSYATVGGVKTTGFLSTDTWYHDGFVYNTTGTSSIYHRYDALYLTKGSTTVNILKGTAVSQIVQATPTFPSFPVNADGILEDTIILGYVYLIVDDSAGAGTLTATYTPITIDTAATYIPYNLTIVTGVTTSGNYLQITFPNTSGADDAANYEKLRYRTMFTELSTGLEAGTGVMIDLAGFTNVTSFTNAFASKLEIPDIQVGPYSSAINGWVKIYTGDNAPTDYFTGTAAGTGWVSGRTLIYYSDTEFLINSSASAVTHIQYSASAPEVLMNTTGMSYGIAGKQSNFYLGFYNGMFNNYDYFTVGNSEETSATRIYVESYIDTDNKLFTYFKQGASSTSDYATIAKGTFESSYNNELVIFSNKLNYIQTVEIAYLNPAFLYDRVTEIKVDKVRYAEIIKGSFLKAYFVEADYETGGIYEGATPRRMVRIIDTKNDATDASLKILYTDGPIDISVFGGTYQTTAYPTVEQYVDEYKGLRIKPFKIHPDSIPNGTEERQSSILSVMDTGTNLFKALTNKNKIAFRYLVDSFGLGITADCKQVYANIGAERLNMLSFVNMPSVKSLKKSQDPIFSTQNHSMLSTDFLAKGGDDTQNPSFYFSLAAGKGRSTMGYFFPYVIVDDNGARVSVPPAAWAASTYMKKFTGGVAGITPWTICAGIVNGKIDGIVKTEMDFNNDDLANLHGMGVDPIVYYIGNGFCINDESTAQVYPQSSLSLIHSREVLIELENRIYNMLLRYQWKMNNAETRGEISYKADKICKELKDQGGLYDFKNVMDESNNTPYIIYLGMGVLDTYVEIVKGMGVIVNNITILKKGDIASGGFQ